MRVQQVLFRCGSRLQASDARKLVASLAGENGKPEFDMLMNYENGRTRTAFPLVHYRSNQQGFSMLAYGDEAIEHMVKTVPIIHAGLCQHNGSIVQLSHRTLDMSASLGYERMFTVPRMVVQKKPEHLGRMKNPETGRSHVERLFRRSIARHAAAVGIELPEQYDLEFLGARRTFADKAKSGGAGRDIVNLGLREAQFRTNLHLKGIWTCGYMIAKGNGHFDQDYGDR